jgi:Transcriptional regulator
MQKRPSGTVTGAPNNTLRNGLRVLERIAGTHRDFAVSELAAALELPRSHVHRLLRTLVEAGYVLQSRDTRKYRSDHRILALAGPFADNHPLRIHGGPVLRSLSGAARAAAYLAVCHQGAPLIVMSDYFGGAKKPSHLGLGERLPRHASAFGKLFLALQRLDIPASELERRTPFTITTLRELREETEKIRRQGYSVSRGENTEAFYSFAAPVHGRAGELLGAIGLARKASAVDPREEKRLVGLVLKAADSLALRLVE